MKNKLLKYQKLSTWALGMLCSLAMPPYYVFPLMWAGFSGLLFFLTEAKTKRKSFALGYWFGFGFFSCSLSWICNALWIEPAKTGWLVPIVFISSGAFFGLFTAFPALISYYIKSNIGKIAVFASSWTIFEWLRSFILTGFPWNLIGSSLAFSPEFIQTAAFWGTYGLSFIAIIFSALPFIALKERKKSACVCAIMLITAILLWGYGYVRISYLQQEDTSQKVRLVQPSIAQTMKWDDYALDDNFRQYVALSYARPLDGIDFVIWGETASPYNPRFHTWILPDMISVVPTGGYLLFGVVDYEFVDGDYVPSNSMMIINDKGSIIDTYKKIHLVPFGEYIPLKKYLPQWIQPIANIVGEFRAGEKHKVFDLDGKLPFGALICYEIIFPAEITDKANRPEWLVVLTNDGWYGKSAGPYQHLVAAQLRAVEEGLPIVRSANSGISAVIDAFGQVQSKIGLSEIGILDASVPSALKETLYAKYGNIIIISICFLLLAVFFAKMLRHYINKSQD